MHLRDPVDLVTGWLQDSLFLVLGATGLLLIFLGLRRDDVMRPIFLVAGIGLTVVGFGVQFFGLQV